MSEWLWETFAKWDTFHKVSGLASIVGLGITLWVWVRVGNIQKTYVRKALLPYYAGKLKGLIKNLNQHDKRQNFLKAVSDLSVCRTTLKDLAPHLDEERAAQVRLVVQQIQQLQSQQDDQPWNQCIAIIGDLTAIAQTVENLTEEIRWGGRHGNE